MPDFIRLEIDDGIAVATLDSPATRNALGKPEHFAAIEDLCHQPVEKAVARLSKTSSKDGKS